MTDKEVLNAYERTGGVLKGHFLLTSGRHSDTYMQSAKLFVHPDEAEKIVAALAEKVKDYKADMVVSPAVGGIILGYELARQLGVTNIFAERENGAMTLRRGFALEKGMKVIVVEDVVTTGGSVKEVIALCKELGADVVACASVVDRSNGKVEFDVPYVPLLSMEVKSWEPADCPLCKAGADAPYKPGSRK
ncbi:MAG: orotate phosphoribosyltransferase [Clostridia bacterium]|nr:orotate phosphoribosyltransferase [Clostridia bacterium]